MSSVDASILICTRNRAEHLHASMPKIVAAAGAAPFPTEVVVVDNGSTDSTVQVLSQFQEQLPLFRVLSDPIAGKSGALNRAMPRVRGQAIVFTDDDVHVGPSWVKDMATPILEGRADAVCGRVVLADHLARPWLTPVLRVAIAEMLDVSGPTPGMVGANMAASKVAAIDIGFDENLGPGARGFDDDVLFNLRLKAAGYRLVGSEGPAVEHHIDASRLTYKSMTGLAVNDGWSNAYLWHHWLGEDLKFIGLRSLAYSTWLSAYRAVHKSRPDSYTQREFLLAHRTSFFRNLIQERKVPPRYRGTTEVALSSGRPLDAAGKPQELVP